MYFGCWVEEIEVMSDLSIYELEDIIWDEFGQSDDHIVPHSSDDNANEHASQGDSHKKPRVEVIDVSTNADEKCAAKCASLEEETDFSTINNSNNTMLEKEPWCQTTENMLSASCDNDSVKEVTSLASDSTRISNLCFNSNNINSLGELCSDDPILSSRCTAVDNNSFNYSLTNISQPDNDLGFMNNDCADKESSDLLYYGWCDIGNFEDIDRMFRSCDSSFGLGTAGNEDEISWFSSSEAIEGSADVLKSNLKFSCPDSNALSVNLEPLKLKNESSSVNDSSMKSASDSNKASSRLIEIDEPPSRCCLSFMNGSNKISKSKDEFILRDQGVEFSDGGQFRISTKNQSENNRMINFQQKKQKHQNQKEGKRKDKCVENDDLLHHVGNLQKKDIHLPSEDTSHNGFASIGIQQQNQHLGHGSLGYLHRSVPYVQSKYNQPSDQTTGPKLSGIKSEYNVLTSFSPKEVQSKERSNDLWYETDITSHEIRAKLHHQQQFQPTFTSNSKHVNLVIQASICDPNSLQVQSETENQSDIEGVNMGLPAELGIHKVQENSSINSGLNDLSLQATSFRQLQQVMEQLDLRTKLCIRDSLYRLARSAEQRHNYANLNCSHGDDRDTSGTLIAEGPHKCTGFMDIETDTNPIDRSIAHLLFSRPTDSSVMPAPNTLAVESHSMIPGSVEGSHIMIENILCHEEREPAVETDKKVSNHQ